MSKAPLSAVGREYSVMLPPVVIRPILLAPPSTNQSAPSDPTVMPKGSLFAGS
jgi:hypothetical protein